MESPRYSSIRSTWRRLDGKWSLCHRERQGPSYQEYYFQQCKIDQLMAKLKGIFCKFMVWLKADLIPTQCNSRKSNVFSGEYLNQNHQNWRTVIHRLVRRREIMNAGPNCLGLVLSCTITGRFMPDIRFDDHKVFTATRLISLLCAVR